MKVMTTNEDITLRLTPRVSAALAMKLLASLHAIPSEIPLESNRVQISLNAALPPYEATAVIGETVAIEMGSEAAKIAATKLAEMANTTGSLKTTLAIIANSNKESEVLIYIKVPS